MKKKLYLQPAIDVMGIQPLQLLDASRGWSQNGDTPNDVEQEDEVDKDDYFNDDIGGYGGFKDLD